MQSGLLAGVASQLYGFFKDEGNYSSDTSRSYKDAVVAACYAAILFNVSATLSDFLIIDAMGEMQYRAATLPKESEGTPLNPQDVCSDNHRYLQLGLSEELKAYTRGWKMDILVLHCTCSPYPSDSLTRLQGEASIYSRLRQVKPGFPLTVDAPLVWL